MLIQVNKHAPSHRKSSTETNIEENDSNMVEFSPTRMQREALLMGHYDKEEDQIMLDARLFDKH